MEVEVALENAGGAFRWADRYVVTLLPCVFPTANNCTATDQSEGKVKPMNNAM